MIRADVLISSMTPSVGDYFRSLYYPATHLSPVDLEHNLPQNACPQSDVISRAQRVVSLPGVQKVLSDPLSYQPEEMVRKNKVLRDQGFRILARKPILKPGAAPEMMPFYSVSEHSDLPNWIIKAAGYRVPQDQMVLGLQNDCNEMSLFTTFESLLRLTMNQRIREVAKGLGIDLVVPDEYAVPYQHPEQGDVSRRYFVISQKLNLKSEDETVAHISRMGEPEQIELARKISLLIKNIGFADASFDNIRFTVDGKLAFIDTEPAGLLVSKADPFHTKGHSVEKCARLGLFTFKTLTDQKGLNALSQEVDRHYKASLKEVSITRIILSIICPLIPLVFLVIAVVNRIRIGRMAEQIVDGDIGFGTSQRINAMTNPSAFQTANQEHQAKTKPLRESYFSAIDGVPFAAAGMV